jgi:hypothetical protein
LLRSGHRIGRTKQKKQITASRVPTFAWRLPRIAAYYANLRDCSLRSECDVQSGRPSSPSPQARRELQTAFLNEARSDCRNARLGIAKRVRRRMDRVVPQDEIVLVRSRRAENELGVGQRFEFDCLARRLESHEVPVPQFARGRQDTRCDGDPEDGMARRGLVTPALPAFKRTAR